MIKWKKSFKKDHKKLTQRQRAAWAEAIALFALSPYHEDLRRHKLLGRYAGLESIDILPDLRAVFKEDELEIAFYYIRNHNQLYR